MPCSRQPISEYPRPIPKICLDEIPICADTIVYQENVSDGDENKRAAKRRRIELAANAYLRGEPVFILTAGLKGPFDKGWKNPWLDQKKVEKKNVAEASQAGIMTPTTRKSQITTVASNGILRSGSSQVHGSAAAKRKRKTVDTVVGARAEETLESGSAADDSRAVASKKPYVKPDGLYERNNELRANTGPRKTARVSLEHILSNGRYEPRIRDKRPAQAPEHQVMTTVDKLPRISERLQRGRNDIRPLQVPSAELAELLKQPEAASREQMRYHHNMPAMYNSSRAEFAILRSEEELPHAHPPRLDRAEIQRFFDEIQEIDPEERGKKAEERLPEQSLGPLGTIDPETTTGNGTEVSADGHAPVLPKEPSKTTFTPDEPSAQLQPDVVPIAMASNMANSDKMLGTWHESQHSNSTTDGASSRLYPDDVRQLSTHVPSNVDSNSLTNGISSSRSQFPSREAATKPEKRLNFTADTAGQNQTQSSIKSALRVSKARITSQGKPGNVEKTEQKPTPATAINTGNNSRGTKFAEQTEQRSDSFLHRTKSQVARKGILKSSASHAVSTPLLETDPSLSTGIKQDAQQVHMASIEGYDGAKNGNEDEGFDLNAAITDLGSFLGPWDPEKEASGLVIV